MKDKILKRLQELTEELEKDIKSRDFHAVEARRLDAKIRETSSSIHELKSLLDN